MPTKLVSDIFHILVYPFLSGCTGKRYFMIYIIFAITVKCLTSCQIKSPDQNFRRGKPYKYFMFPQVKHLLVLGFSGNNGKDLRE